jgi:ATP-binding cassette subfamily F protein uup
LSFKEQQELSKLPELIAELEATQVQLTAQINDPDFYKQPQQIVNDALAKLQSIEQDITKSYARWDELEANS